MENEPVYTSEEQSKIIAELQDNLRTISSVNVGIPRVAVDSIYSLDTKMTVAAFQKEYGLEETGAVDYRTWDAVTEEAGRIRNSRAPANPVTAFQPPHLVVRPGDTGDIVCFIQILLRRVCRRLDHASSIEIDGCYGIMTEEAVKRVQKLADLTPTGHVDKETWNALTDLYVYPQNKSTQTNK